MKKEKRERKPKKNELKEIILSGIQDGIIKDPLKTLPAKATEEIIVVICTRTLGFYHC